MYSRRKVVTSDSLEADGKVPAALNLPFGKLFFGFKAVPYNPPEPAVQSPTDSSGQPVSTTSTPTRHRSLNLSYRPHSLGLETCSTDDPLRPAQSARRQRARKRPSHRHNLKPAPNPGAQGRLWNPARNRAFLRALEHMNLDRVC